MNVIAEYEREKIRERTMRGRREKARQGFVVGGRRPYGYSVVSGLYAVEEKEAQNVLQIFRWLVGIFSNQWQWQAVYQIRRFGQDKPQYSDLIGLDWTGSIAFSPGLPTEGKQGYPSMTVDRPKVMLPIAGKPLLRWLIDGFKKESINDITVVGGYRADAIDAAGIKLVVNERYAETGELASLACAVESLDSDTVIAYGDLLFRSYVLRDLVESKADFAVVVDSLMTGDSNLTVRDFAYCSRRDDRGLFGTPVLLERVTSAADEKRVADGRWVGLLGVSRAGLNKLKAMIATLRAEARFDELDLPALLNALAAAGSAIEVVYVHGHWRGVNDLDDLRQAVDFAHAQAPFDR